mmetsp:Transcript_31193/g.67342  ORF Transcript_31193/g.67342 Transcript_31193/m.67342 type:complete len:81 (-) Transcript_31193:673-915(-)
MSWDMAYVMRHGVGPSPKDTTTNGVANRKLCSRNDQLDRARGCGGKLSSAPQLLGGHSANHKHNQKLSGDGIWCSPPETH